MKVVEIADLIRSRFKFFLKDDPVDKIFLDKDNNVIFVLFKDISDHDLTQLRFKYVRAVEGYDVNVIVYNKTNTWRHDDDTGILYSRWDGFTIILPPYHRTYEYGAF